jgi:coupling of ubiquitin conjugation to ER degradation protein 1
LPSSSKPDLISRFKLNDRLTEELPSVPSTPSNDKGKGKASSNWNQSQPEREAAFKKRRDEMILRARKQMQDQLKNEIPSQP